MVDYKQSSLFEDDSVDKQIVITTDDGFAKITNTELHKEKFEISESICSESELRFGCCEASSIKFTISNVLIPLKNKWLTLKMTLDGKADNPFEFGRYKVFSDKPSSDRTKRDIVAYDAMYDIINADVSAWYNTILPNADSQVTLKEFRDRFFAHFGIVQEKATLVNDSMIVTKTIEPSQLSGKTVATAICEINGCFGHIGRNGKFQYVYLKEMVEGLYPSDALYPSNDLFLADPMNAEPISKSYYTAATYEDFVTAKINQLQIRQEEDDIGVIYGTGDNCYIVQDNFLTYGKSAEELQTIAENLYSVICKVWYRPAHVEAKGNPCLEVGDGVRIHTKYEIVYTYILQRTMKGIQALKDTYDSEGEERQNADVNSVRDSIIQLKGKTNKITRNLEETRFEVFDKETGLYSKIQQNANNISLKVNKGEVVSEINLSPEEATIKAEKINLEGMVKALELETKYATIETLESNYATIKNLDVANAAINTVNSRVVNAENLIADNVKAIKASVETLSAVTADIGNLKADKLDVSEFTAANISAKGITVNAANVKGQLTAAQINTGSLSIGATQISGTQEVQVVTSYTVSTIKYLNHNGEKEEKRVITDVGLKTVRVLGVYSIQ